jgi:hypothetical protein
VTTLASTAVGTPFFPGQSMTQQAAMNRATSDINSAVCMIVSWNAIIVGLGSGSRNG